ncbi:hypothetical protein [Pedobacter sp.]|uniref:hypothetical protein n=1 Tax=Pedobacter sp. TaxID=1411316 RepID=UPI0031D1179E
MKKLTLFKGRATACLILVCLFLAQGCRKDHFPYLNPESSIAKVNDQAIDNWYKENPISQIIGIDWSKARQATIDGKHLVRVPTLNIDKIKPVLATKSTLKQGLLSSNGKIATVKNKVGVEQNPVIDEGGNGSGNTNYYSAHPPEVYFIQDPLTSKLHTYLINFIPDNEAAGFGQGGNWTGKLYEWDTKSDTVLVQTFVNNVLTDRSVRVFYHVDENGGIALTKPQKLQSLTPLKDKQVSGIFGWLLDKILDGLGALGSIFGLTELVPSTSSSTGHHYHYRFISHPSSPGTDWVDVGNPGSQFLSLGLPLVSSYLAGMDTGTPLVEVTYNTYDYNGINHTGGPNNNNVPNADGIYVMEYLTLSPAAQDYILSVEAIPVAHALKNYLDTKGYTIENKQFAAAATEYLQIYRDGNINSLIQFSDFLTDNPFVLISNVPCEVLKKWIETAKFAPDLSIRSKLNDLKNSRLSQVLIGIQIARIQKITDARSPIVNMDYFPVKINQLPIVNNQRLSADQFLHYLRVNLDLFTNQTKTFKPYNTNGIDDRDLWNSNNPKGSIIALDIVGPENASVITSRSSSTGWTFTTIYEPMYGDHPVSGHRDFGYVVNPDGSYEFFTRGVDRLTNVSGDAMEFFPKVFGSTNGIPFSQADALWNSLQDGIKNFVDTHGGIAIKEEKQILRPQWSLVKEVIDGKKPLSSLSQDCK